MSADPRVSEWGNPLERTSSMGTWGTETSKYPEEEKETSIP